MSHARWPRTSHVSTASTPAPTVGLGCNEEPFVDVCAVRWVNADQIPEGERRVAGRPLNPDGTPHQRRPQATCRRGFAQIAGNQIRIFCVSAFSAVPYRYG